MVLGVEEELDSITDIGADVTRAVYQLTAWADLDRVGRGGSGATSDGRTGCSGSIGRC